MHFADKPCKNKVRIEDGRDLGVWVKRYVSCLQLNEQRNGHLFPNDKGRPMKVSELDVYLHSILSEVQKRFPTVIPPNVKVEDDYSCSRSLRCGATSEALNVNIPPSVIDANNRWRK